MAKKLNPQEQQRVQQRKAFVQANPDLDPAEARKRFFVQTRVQELTKSGVEVTKERRAALRQQFTSGDISRKGFLSPQDVQRSSNTNSTNNNVVPTPERIPGGVAAAAARAKGMVNTSTAISSVAPKTTGTSTTTSSAAPKTDRNPFNNPGSPFTKAEQDKFKSAISNIDYKGSKTQKVASFVGDTLELGNFAKAAKFVGRTALSTGDSINATFVNPAANLIGKAFNKNPNLREAGPLEATLTTADALATIYSVGGSQVVGNAFKRVSEPLVNKFSRTVAKTPLTKAESAALRSQASKDAAQSVFDRAPGKSKSTPKPEPEFISGGIDGPVPFKNKPGTKTPKTKPSTVTEVKGEKAVPKPTSKKTKAPKVESADPVVGKSDKDLAPYSDTVRKGPVEMSSTQVPKTKPTPDVAPDTTPAVGSSKKVEWVRPGSTTPDVVLKADQVIPTYEVPYTQKFAPRDSNWTPNDLRTTKGETEIKNTASFRDPKVSQVKYTASKKNKQLSKPIETTSKIVNEMPVSPKTITKAPVETHANAGIEYPTTTNFTTKQGYDNWLATGGRVKLQEIGRSNPNDLIKFYQRNQKFIKSREAAKDAAKELANQTEVNAAKKAIAHSNAVKAGTPELSPAVQEAAKLKAAEVPTVAKPKVEPAPAKKPAAKKPAAKKNPTKKKSGSKGKTPKALNNLLMGRGGL
jgi:hypothetical protein